MPALRVHIPQVTQLPGHTSSTGVYNTQVSKTKEGAAHKKQLVEMSTSQKKKLVRDFTMYEKRAGAQSASGVHVDHEAYDHGGRE